MTAQTPREGQRCSWPYSDCAHSAALTRREPLDVERLAAIIRDVDGNHDLGAAALAEAVIARLEAADKPLGIGPRA